MKTWGFPFLVILAFLLTADLGVAEVTYYFNWYCSGCSHIGARTTGTEGPFTSPESCESARSAMQNTMDRRGGGVNTVGCYSTGWSSESSTPSQPSYERSPRPQPEYSRPTYTQPQSDTVEQQRLQEERRRQEEEAERARQAEIERQRQEKFRRDQSEALHSLKGSSYAPFGIKSNPTGDLQLKGLLQRDEQARALSQAFPAWRQLNCVATIFRGVLRGAKDGNLNETHYLAQEMKNALDSQPLGVDCGPMPPPPKLYGENELRQAKIVPFYRTLMEATVQEGKKLQAVNRELKEIANAYEQQKERQGRSEEATAPLLKVQRQLNEINSRKIEAMNRLNGYGEMSNQVLRNPARAKEILDFGINEELKKPEKTNPR